MTLQDMKKLGGMIMSFLYLFRGCFPRLEGYRLCAVYVKGQLSDLHRKNCEAIAAKAGVAPRTLQRFVESIKWNEELVRDRCIEIVVKDYAHPEAIGLIDESGTTKSGKCTSGVGRQYNGNRGKIENCTVGVHLGYWTPQLKTILDSRLYLPEDWANDPQRRKKTIFPRISSFRRSNSLPSA
jgi:SRSO17 transposase